MLVKPGLCHRGIGHGLDVIEPFRNSPFLRFGFLPVGLTFFPLVLSFRPILRLQESHQRA